LSLAEFDALLPKAVEYLEKLAGVRITKQKLDKVLREAFHIVLHELAHAFVKQALPWVNSLEERQHVLVDEVLARFLERKVSLKLHSFVESLEEQMEEIRMYSPLTGLDWTAGFYSRLYKDFEEHCSKGRSIETFARKILEYC
jgi:hypothetical protein